MRDVSFKLILYRQMDSICPDKRDIGFVSHVSQV